MKIWKMFGKSSGALVIACLALFAAMPMASAQEKSGSVRVVPINGTVGGRTYGQWSAEWWHRALAVTSLDDCALMNQPEPNQANGPVFFLAGTPSGPAKRQCNVPSGKFLMFPVFNVEWSKAEALAQQPPTGGCLLPGVVPSGTEDAALRACAKAQADHALRPDATLEADVDGIPLPNLTTFRAASPFPPFSFTTVAGNPFGICPAAGPCPLTSQAVADGYWIILQPLSLGQHIIHFAATVPFPEIDFTLSTATTYTLTVQPQK
jgi:hypothetical protein